MFLNKIRGLAPLPEVGLESLSAKGKAEGLKGLNDKLVDRLKIKGSLFYHFTNLFIVFLIFFFFFSEDNLKNMSGLQDRTQESLIK